MPAGITCCQDKKGEKEGECYSSLVSTKWWRKEGLLLWKRKKEKKREGNIEILMVVSENSE